MPFGRGALLQPFLADAANGLGELVGIGAFDVILASAQAFRAFFVVAKLQAAQDANGNPTKFGRRPKPFENLETGHLRHVQIEQDEIGNGMGRMVGKRRFAPKIGKDLIAIGDDLKGVLEFGPGKGASKKEQVVFLVFRYKNGCGSGHISPVSVQCPL